MNNLLKTRVCARGISLIEMVVYIGLLVLLLVAVLTIVVSIFGSYDDVQNKNKAVTSGEAAMERMSRDIRNAASVSGAGSVFDANPGDLRINTTDSAGNPMLIEFLVQDGALAVKENSGSPSVLTDPTVTVQNLLFSSISTSNSHAIRIVLTLQAGVSPHIASSTFYDTVVLRGSY